MRKWMAVFANVVFPGFGSFFIGKYIQGIFQVSLFVIAIILAFTVLGMVFAIPIWGIAVIWALLTAVISAPKGT